MAVTTNTNCSSLALLGHNTLESSGHLLAMMAALNTVISKERLSRHTGSHTYNINAHAYLLMDNDSAEQPVTSLLVDTVHFLSPAESVLHLICSATL